MHINIAFLKVLKKVLWRTVVILTLQPKQGGGQGLIPSRAPPLVRHDKVSLDLPQVYFVNVKLFQADLLQMTK